MILVFTCKRDEQLVPVAGFTYTITTECAVPAEVQFTNQSLYATIYRWNFGDSSDVVYAENPTHSYNHEGIYTVELISYGRGGMNIETEVVYVVRIPQINFTTNDTIVNSGDTVHFTAQLTSGVLPSSWFWTFGDGITSTLQNPTHVYTYSGIYDVTLTAVNACGSTYVEKKQYIMVNSTAAAPVVNFIADHVFVIVGQPVNFTDLSTNNPTLWNWTFQGGVPMNSNIKNPVNITYSTPGIYDVALTASNQYGSNTNTKTGYITVLGYTPTTALIKKITVKQMPFLTPLVNLYYKITDFTPTTYINARMQALWYISQANLPVFWDIIPAFQISLLDHVYKIELWNRKGGQQYDVFINFVQFNLNNFTTPPDAYPAVINLTQNQLSIDIEIQWQ